MTGGASHSPPVPAHFIGVANRFLDLIEALCAREDPAAPSAYDDDPTARSRDTTAFTARAIDAGLALDAAAATPVS